MKKEHFLQSEGFKSVAASILSILIGLAVGSIVIIIVGLTSPNLSLSSAWDGIRIVFGGLFSTGRSASGTTANVSCIPAGVRIHVRMASNRLIPVFASMIYLIAMAFMSE